MPSASPDTLSLIVEKKSERENKTMNNQNVGDHCPDYSSREAKPARRRERKGKNVAVAEESGDGGNGWFRKRKLSDEQVRMLEICFNYDHKLESERKDRIASELRLDPRQVAVWFQNRRARWKTKRVEDEYLKLKNEYEKVVIEKCHLDTNVLHLKQRLYDAEREIQRLAKRVEETSSNSLISSSVSVEANHTTPIFGDYEIGMGGDGYEGLLNSPIYIDELDWTTQFM